ncbi:MAG: FecR domain-containing protein [Ginsengibacter sp.]
MNELRLTYLFQAYFNKKATPAERYELMVLLAQTENDNQVTSLLERIWQQFNSQTQLFTDEQGEALLANIFYKAARDKQIPVVVANKRPYKWLYTAAAAILFFGIAGIYLWVNTHPSSHPVAKSNKVVKKVKDIILPGSTKAVLTLSNGSHIVLDSARQGIVAKQGNSRVTKLNTATLSYKAGTGQAREVVYNTLSTPRGGEYQLILPDGTKVWLNASSSIRFPTLFTGKERKVAVTGETYFEVAKNAAMPFEISVMDMKVQVLGTHLDIMAYDDEGSMNTTLLEGSLKVSNASESETLVPGQQSVINKTGRMKVVDVSVDEVTAWKEGWFQFNACNIEQVMRQISRWYDVDIVYEGKIPTGHFSGIVSRENDILQVLKIMQAGGVRYKIEGRKVVILS